MRKIFIVPVIILTLFLGGIIALSVMDLAPQQTQTTKEIQIDNQ